MNSKKRVAIIAFLLIASISNYLMKDNDNVRAVQFVWVFAIGALSALLVRELLEFFRKQP
ncbi:MAG TPA: hypothetical protein VF676_10935 [Flavobacterium sp.]|jgi:hypothetical protein